MRSLVLGRRIFLCAVLVLPRKVGRRGLSLEILKVPGVYSLHKLAKLVHIKVFQQLRIYIFQQLFRLKDDCIGSPPWRFEVNVCVPPEFMGLVCCKTSGLFSISLNFSYNLPNLSRFRQTVNRFSFLPPTVFAKISKHLLRRGASCSDPACLNGLWMAKIPKGILQFHESSHHGHRPGRMAAHIWQRRLDHLRNISEGLFVKWGKFRWLTDGDHILYHGMITNSICMRMPCMCVILLKKYPQDKKDHRDKK